MSAQQCFRSAAFVLATLFLGYASPSSAATARLHESPSAKAPVAQQAGTSEAAPTRENSTSTWVLMNTAYEPLNFVQEPFTGNGYLGLRIPAIGQGYQGGNLGKSGFPLYNTRYTSSLVAGVYERTQKSDYIASLPTWSEMDLSVDGQVLNAYTPQGQVEHYRQNVDMRDGVVTTSMTWIPSAGKAVDITYTILANHARRHLGEVELTFKPSWSGSITLNALLNGKGAERITEVSRTIDPATGTATLMLRTPGRNTVVSEMQYLVPDSGMIITHRSAVAPASDKSTAGVQWSIPVTAGRTYQVIKYVGISTSNDPGTPQAVAARTVKAAAHAGWAKLLAADQQAWAKLWAYGITAPRQHKLQTSIHSAFYLLYSSIRAGLAWSIPPAGLSSDNYGGEIFWDADTWMFPSLLTFHPELARSIVDFRYNTMSAAKANAAGDSYRGAMWAWDNGPTGTCGGLAPCKHYEDHLQSDIALAQWQYYEATGDRQWLARRGYPVIKAVADFWLSRVRMGADGKYHIDKVTGPDEFTANVDDESATNAGAIVTLRNAVTAAEVLGLKPDPRWAKVANNIYVAVDADGTHPEYRGYKNQTVKQADTVLMTYPYGYVTNPTIAAKDLDRYMAVTDPGGPAMTASVEGIIAAQTRQPGCLDYTLMQNAYLPFVRGAYDQFLETQYLVPSAHQGPPAFSFATGAGGFLQMFPFGFAGLRWKPSALALSPTLPPQLSKGITLRGVRYQGRSLTISIGPRTTTATLNAGQAMQIITPNGTVTFEPQKPVQIPTARPDLDPTQNLARCQPVEASSSMRANRPAAAVDGNIVTSWQAASPTSSFRVVLESHADSNAEPVETSGTIIHWGENRPARFSAFVRGETSSWKQVAAGAVPSSGALQIRWGTLPTYAVRFDFHGEKPASIAELDIPATQGHGAH